MKYEKYVKKDVIIAGGGMAGVSAAISAAEAGADVLVLEQLSYLGGTATGGMVVPLMGGGIFTQEGTKVVSGNLDKIFSHINKYENAPDYNCNPEIVKYVLDEMMAERKVDILFSTFISSVEGQDGSIKNIIAANKSGFARYRAKVFIDATGDADVAYRAGICCKKGRDSDGLTQAVTLRFAIGNTDVKKARAYMDSETGKEKFAKQIKEYSDKTGLEILETHGFQNFEVTGRPNELVFNCPRLIGVDATDSKSLSKAYLDGRKKILAYYQLLKENIPGCENAFISNMAGLLGIRESRRIQGEYVLTGEDVISGRKFADGVACNSWYMDIHNPAGKGILGWGGRTGKAQYPKGGWNDIPFRCLYSNKVKNLIVAGRCISATHEALAAVRIMASCIAMGQAAGTAAGIMAKDNMNVSEVDTDMLREKLVDEGALITGINLQEIRQT